MMTDPRPGPGPPQAKKKGPPQAIKGCGVSLPAASPPLRIPETVHAQLALQVKRSVKNLTRLPTPPLASTTPLTCSCNVYFYPRAVAAGGPQLRDLSLSSELFKASSMQAVVSISKLEYQ